MAGLSKAWNSGMAGLSNAEMTAWEIEPFLVRWADGTIITDYQGLLAAARAKAAEWYERRYDELIASEEQNLIQQLTAKDGEITQLKEGNQGSKWHYYAKPTSGRAKEIWELFTEFLGEEPYGVERHDSNWLLIGGGFAGYSHGFASEVIAKRTKDGEAHKEEQEGVMKTMLCSSCGYPINKDKDRIVVSTFTGVTKNVRWYCPKDCGNGGMKGVLKKARQLLRVG